jgi:mRNA-degrading endonuclease RelE of RelBE toxin-antitoxin system
LPRVSGIFGKFWALKKIPIKDRRFINDSVKQLANWTDFHNVKSLINYQYQYRLHVGRYRVFFDKKESLKILKIEEVKKNEMNERINHQIIEKNGVPLFVLVPNDENISSFLPEIVHIKKISSIL